MKKKILSLILCFAMLASMLSGSFMYASAYEQGDVNGDGNVDFLDILGIRRYLVGGFPEENSLIAEMIDVNGDGRVNSRDITALRAMLKVGPSYNSDSVTVEPGDAVYWEYNGEELIVGGEGEIRGWIFDTKYPWSESDIISTVKRIVIEEGVTGIGYGAFYEFINLQEVVLPESLEYIDDFNFGGWYTASSITIPARVTDIGEYAFFGYDSYEESFGTISGYAGTYAETYAEEHNKVFESLGELPSVPEGIMGDLNGDSVLDLRDVVMMQSSLGKYTVEGDPLDMNGDGMISVFDLAQLVNCIGFNSGSADGSESAGDGVYWNLIDGVLTVYGSGAIKDWTSYSNMPWYNVRKNISKIVIEEGIAGIGYGAFADCYNVTEVVLPETLNYIGDFAFAGISGSWKGLKEIKIPRRVTSIGDYVFYNGLAGTENYINTISGYEGSYAEQYAFDNGISFIYEDNSSSTGGGGGGPVLIDEGVCGDNITWALDIEGLIKISGAGAMTNFASAADAPWHEYADAIQYLWIEDGITSIGDFAFSGCVSLSGIQIPETVSVIGRDAFRNCDSVVELFIPANVKTIKAYTFAECDNLQYLNVEEGVTAIAGYGAFYKCQNLLSAEIPATVKTIGSDVFYGCKVLTIYGESGSYAETYAANKGIDFAIKEPEVGEPENPEIFVAADLMLDDITVNTGESFSVPAYASIWGVSEIECIVSYDNSCLTAQSVKPGNMPYNDMITGSAINPFVVTFSNDEGFNCSGELMYLEFTAGTNSGTYPVSVAYNALDLRGNVTEKTATFNVTVEEPEPPFIPEECYADISAEDITVTAGERFFVPIYADVSDIQQLDLSIYYPNTEFTMVDYPIQGEFPVSDMAWDSDLTANPYWLSSKTADGLTGSGEYAVLQFEAGTQPGTYSIDVVCTYYDTGWNTNSYGFNFDITVEPAPEPEPEPEPDPEPESGTYIKINDGTVRPGEVATVPVFASLEDMYSMEYLISYDSALSIYQKPVQTGFEELDMTPGGNIAKNPYRVIFDAMDPMTESGNAMEMYFQTPTEPGRYTVNVNFCAFNDDDEVVQDVSFDIIVKPVITAGELTVGYATARPGETVEIPISLAGNPGVGYMEAIVKCAEWLPEGVTVEGVSVGEAFSDMAFSWEYMDNGDVLLKWMGESDCTNDGVMANLILSVTDAAPEGAYDLPVEVVAMENKDAYIELDMFFGGYIEIFKYQQGDINGDSKLNVRDIVTLRRYIAGGFEDTISYIDYLLDVNGDGRYNVRDVVELRRIIANS